MPLRSYRCSRGHEFEIVESMDGPRATRCPVAADDETCGDRDLAPVIQIQQRPIVKGGTPRHHARTPGRSA